MAHNHHHHGESLKDYFTEQLLTILVCGVFGFTAIQLYRENRLGFLADQFHMPVLLGGIGILLIVFLRAVAVWKEAGEYQAAQIQDANCNQDHVHGADCNHVNIPGQDDGEHDHSDHSHSHDLSWFFARMLILVFPVTLFFFGLPNSNLSLAAQIKLANNGNAAIGGEALKDLAKDATELEKTESNGVITRKLKTKTGLELRERTANGETTLEIIGGQGVAMKFNDLNDAAYDPAKRESMQGQTAILEGRFLRSSDKEFSLFRMKMTCCTADQVPLKVRIIVPQALSQFNNGDWVKVKGQIQFLKAPGKDNYIPVLMVADITDVKQEIAPARETEQ